MNSKKEVQHVYLVGAKSLGAYGGYETFVYKLTEYHQNKENIKYHVACKANGDGCMDESKFDGVTKINDHEFEFHNAHCFKIDVPQIGPAQAIYYDVAALKACCEHIEVILVDDESPDSCGKMCDDYEKMDTRIKVVHKKNGGLSDARNAGMKVATGDLITFVDSDDYISKDFIEILFEAMLENKSDIAIANMKRTSKRDEKNTSTAWKTSNFKSEDALISMLYGIPFGTSACGKLFKRNLFKGVEFPYGKFSEDLFTIYKTILKSKSVTYVEFDGYFYYYRDEGTIVVSGYIPRHCANSSCVKECFFRRSRTFSPNFMFATFLWRSYRAVTMYKGICEYSI